ncbi:MAG: GGDEF domain-containing protein [Nitrospirae bacterium]|nr:GGDEF domain-containing protein [Nitrospirota bacterium]
MAATQTPDSLEKFVKPIPILQWLVVLVLCAHVVVSPAIVATDRAVAFVLILLSGNGLLLYGLPQVLSAKAIASILVIVDTLLVPATLIETGTAKTDLFVVYFGIIMIAGAAGNLKRAMALAAVTCTAYLGFGAFVTLTDQESIPLHTLLLRLPFLLTMTLFYGALAEFAQRERQHKEKLSHDVLHDELTGLPNRRYLLETLARTLEEAKRFNSPLSCAVIDVDNFKDINDTYGHDIGDLVLKDYASLLALASRGYDMAGRLGGDEYVWILPRLEKEGAIMAGERLRESVERHLFGTKESSFQLTASIGITTYSPSLESHSTPAQVLKAADLALYTAKREGRNRVCHLPLIGPVAAEHAPPQAGNSPDRKI